MITSHNNNSEIHFFETVSTILAVNIVIGTNKNISSLPFFVLVNIIKINPINKEKIKIQYLDFSFKGVFEKLTDL